MKTLHKNRLLKLAEHLKIKRGHARFDFRHIWRTIKCGTAGCAVGELPFCFPRSFRYDEANYCDGGSSDLWVAVEEFFGLEKYEANHLFIPTEQNPRAFGGRALGVRATSVQVAQNIIEFVKRKSNG